MFNKTVVIITVLAILIGSFILPVSAKSENSEDIIILYTNDVHCGIDTNIGYDGLALYKREMQEQYENVLLVDAGDAIQGAPIGSLSNGKYIIDLMNAVGYDAAIPGNHEFDYGMEVLMTRAGELDCNYISANLYNLETKEHLFEPYKLIKAGEKTIAFVGVTTPETYFSSTPKHFQNEDGKFIYGFGGNGELYDLLQNAVDSARSEGADYVILLAHLGETDIVEGWSAQEVVEQLSGIDAVIDAHSHDVTPQLVVNSKDGANVIITQTGTKLANIGKMTITEDGQIKTELVAGVPAPGEDSKIAQDGWLEPEGRPGKFVDKSVYGLIAQIDSEFSDILNEKIGTTAYDLLITDPETGLRMVRQRETNLGDLCADAFRYVLDADVGIVNGGGVRTSIIAGDITYRDALSVFPFGNMATLAEVSGQQILDILETGAMKYPGERGSFIHVSGIEYTIDESVESSVQLGEADIFLGVSGEYRVKNVLINGEPLDLTKTYSLASHDYFLKNGGDGWIFSGKCKIIKEDVMTDAEALALYIRDILGGVITEEYRDPYGQERIRTASNVDPYEGNPPTGDASPIVAVFMSLLTVAAVLKKRGYITEQE